METFNAAFSLESYVLPPFLVRRRERPADYANPGRTLKPGCHTK